MQMLNNSYTYYLANGECISYSLSPDCKLVDVIDRLVVKYYSMCRTEAPDIVWVRPDVASALNKEVAGKFLLVGMLPNPTGAQLLKLQTIIGPVTIMIAKECDVPIFIGSEQEFKDNSFNTQLENILCE
jgi:hypothetical protein